MRFHYLTVIEHTANNKQGKARWLCRCDCGKVKAIDGKHLLSKTHPTKSCGCMTGRLISERLTKHGMSHHPAFGVWHSMKQRCEDSKHPAYHNYGARGITVCQQWDYDFAQFWKDMGPTYRRGMDLDRRDNSKGYSPENCRWVSRKVNNRNRRSNRVIVTSYGSMTVSALSELTGIGVTTILYRLDHHWPTELLCAQPDLRNVFTTSGIAVRGTDSLYGIKSIENHAS